MTVAVEENEVLGGWLLSATGTTSCEGGLAEGTGVAAPRSEFDAAALSVALDGDTTDTSWDLSLDGVVDGDRAFGEGGFSWYAEADYTGAALPSACLGLGEFTAARR